MRIAVLSLLAASLLAAAAPAPPSGNANNAVLSPRSTTKPVTTGQSSGASKPSASTSVATGIDNSPKSRLPVPSSSAPDKPAPTESACPINKKSGGSSSRTPSDTAKTNAPTATSKNPANRRAFTDNDPRQPYLDATDALIHRYWVHSLRIMGVRSKEEKAQLAKLSRSQKGEAEKRYQADLLAQEKQLDADIDALLQKLYQYRSTKWTPPDASAKPEDRVVALFRGLTMICFRINPISYQAVDLYERLRLDTEDVWETTKKPKTFAQKISFVTNTEEWVVINTSFRSMGYQATKLTATMYGKKNARTIQTEKLWSERLRTCDNLGASGPEWKARWPADFN